MKITHNQNVMEWLIDMYGNVLWEMERCGADTQQWGRLSQLKRAVSFVMSHAWNDDECPQSLYI